MILSYLNVIVNTQKGVMFVQETERITLEEAADLAGIAVRNMRRYNKRLGAQYEDRPVEQRRKVVTFDRARFLEWLAERGKSAPIDEVPPPPANLG